MTWKQKIRKIIQNLPKGVTGNEFMLFCHQCLTQTPFYKGIFKNGTGQNAEQENKS